jgi:hypothetical protein
MVAALEATTQVTRAVGGATDVDVILELVAKRGRALVSAQALLIELVDGDELVVAAALAPLSVVQAVLSGGLVFLGVLAEHYFGFTSAAASGPG